jgi:hypothetical protein
MLVHRWHRQPLLSLLIEVLVHLFVPLLLQDLLLLLVDILEMHLLLLSVKKAVVHFPLDSWLFLGYVEFVNAIV